MRRAAKVDRESPIQIAIVDYLRLQYPDWIIHHAKGEINKGGLAFMREQAKANRKGAVKGFPDLVVLPLSHIGAIFFEVKAVGNYATPDQKALHARMEALGYRVAVVRSIDDVQERLAAWGIGGTVKIPLRGQIT